MVMMIRKISLSNARCSGLLSFSSETINDLQWLRRRCDGEVVVLTFRVLKFYVISSIEILCDNGEESESDVILRLDRYNFWNFDSRR